MVVLVGIRVIASAERGEDDDEADVTGARTAVSASSAWRSSRWPSAGSSPTTSRSSSFEGQNFLALVSDPFGRGWDLFGTIDRHPTTGSITAGWVRWVQLGVLLAGHVAAVVLAHDGAIGRFGRRRGMRVTWVVAAVAAVSVVAAALLVLR